ncbi:uncharacterized protein LOC124913168 [Impatiens glandulifera]|uniref:uncharacterized protein LOC124913168 n=1 Tax=Impatiens glandulifera TaxID=253017 RepID=UPI001FB06C15|nr:uncharacterized protein LOC124913168 [Impatiens glandulifera]
MNGKFIVGKAWEIIRTNEVVVDWHKVVWSLKDIPRNQFILWLAFRKRLETRDRIKKYMNILDVNCPVCIVKEESIDHLFGECTFVSKLWINFAQNMNITKFPLTWNEIIKLVKKRAKGDSFYANVFKCLFRALVYNTWRERNTRIHSMNKRIEENVWDNIVSDDNILIHTWRGISINEDS